jgi:hypothetical protein
VNKARGANQDVPLAAAVILLAVILLWMCVGTDFGKINLIMQSADVFASEHAGLIAWVLISVLFNAFVIYVFSSRYLSYKRQGQRLKDLTGERRPVSIRQVLIVSGISTLYYAAFFASLDICLAQQDISALPDLIRNIVVATSAVSLAVISSWLYGLRSHSLKKRDGEKHDRKNSVVLGSVKSVSSANREEPVEVNSRSLNGNMLITGSIGSGKTQGTILPYFDQILATFYPTPAVVAIDPKGTFVSEAIKIAAARNVGNHVLHLKLGGNVSFNPIYVDGMLRDGRFIEMAQMIRAASINFSGRSGDSPFWELSAFNLTKNALIYVAAVHNYFTLKDLYEALSLAADDRLAEPLEEAVKTKSFSIEELTNVKHALSYFSQEFKSFDSKLKSGILATATSFLGQFLEYQTSLIFCPTEGDRTITSMDEVVDRGLILLFDIDNPGLARAMGTFVKLHYQQSVLKRVVNVKRGRERAALLIMDEYQDVVSSGYGSLLGDDRFLAKGREANAITIAATQSLSSLESSLGAGPAAKELCQNFRTRIALHSADLPTITAFRELVGDEDREKRTRSYSELSHNAQKNYITGSFESENANISESVSTSMHREAIVTGQEFSKLGTFESIALVYDGFDTRFMRLFLKPYFLKGTRKSHGDIKKMIQGAALAVLLFASQAGAFPNVCDVVKASAFSSCLEYSVSSCVCPGIPPRPCARFTYYVPDTYIEVAGERGSTAFKGLPGVAAQSAATGKGVPYGTEGGDFAAFQARTIPVPMAPTLFGALPCSSGLAETACFGAMSEHLGAKWSTGSADLRQPNHLLWAANPKACLATGAVKSAVGGGEGGYRQAGSTCSTPAQGALPIYPPSPHSACTGWGVFYPRVGIYEGPSQTTASLMVAARMKSLSTEVFHSASSSFDEKWQMIAPSKSQCFREGQNVGFLDGPAFVNDRGRLGGKPKDYLYVVWRRVSCCKDLTDVPAAEAVLASLGAACAGMGGLK